MASDQNVDSSKATTARVVDQATQIPPTESSGVEILIARLRDEGIAKGRAEAQTIVSTAKQEAAEIVAAARRESDLLAAKAGEEAAKLKAAGEDAIRLAMRDTILALEAGLINEFQNMLRKLVKGVLQDEGFLQQLILEMAGKTAPLPEKAEFLLPAGIVSLDDLRCKPEEAKPGSLAHFVLSLGGGMLREGLSFGVSDSPGAGIKVKLVDNNVQIDMTDNAVSQLLLKHMLPRFRALLRGAVIVARGDTAVSAAVTGRPAA